MNYIITNILANPWEAITAIFTIIITFIAWFQLTSVNKTTRADFIHKFNNDFFKESTQEIISLLDYSALKFMIASVNYGQNIPTKEFPYFVIERSIAEQFKPKISSARQEYTAFEIDDNLLGHFEDIGNFEKQRILDISFIYECFSYYIILTWENEEIQKYIKWQRGDGGNNAIDIYEKFEYLYKKCKSLDIAKQNKRWFLLWKLKWFLFRT